MVDNLDAVLSAITASGWKSGRQTANAQIGPERREARCLCSRSGRDNNRVHAADGSKQLMVDSWVLRARPDIWLPVSEFSVGR